ncbi:MAG: CoA activase, partial [Anaerolineae bacterium]|nr:CoA activase [Anaerolineae bacterium]
LGERCTVFMESDLVHCQQQGASVPDLTAGLAYSIAENYLNRVVNGRPIGENIFFQGGVAGNPAVVAAFRQLVGREVIVPPHHDVSGAFGAALLAQEHIGERKTRFHGFDLGQRPYSSRVFECKGCVNRCEITRVLFGDDRPLFYGARCERYERDNHRGSNPGQTRPFDDVPDLVARRLDLLLRGYEPPAPDSGRPRVGLPRALLFYDMFPYWHRFLVELGVDVVLSDVTNPRIVEDTWEHAPAETCFPVKLMLGHVLDLCHKGVEFVFLPSVITGQNCAPGQKNNTYCPLIQSVPHLVSAGLDLSAYGVRMLGGPVHLLDQRYRRWSLRELARPLGVSAKQVRAAARLGAEAQRAFYVGLRRMGAEFLADLGQWPRVAVLVGRPYNTCDPGVSMALPYKLRKLGVVPVPMDCLPLDSVDVSDRFDNMYWRSGQDILAAARLIRRDPRLQAIYVTNFGCGPDSFLLSYFRREMAGRLVLELELDDHTADAGLMTRCEAFFDSLDRQSMAANRQEATEPDAAEGVLCPV